MYIVNFAHILLVDCRQFGPKYCRSIYWTPKIVDCRKEQKGSVDHFGSLWPQKLHHFFGNLRLQKGTRTPLAIYGSRNSHFLAIHGPRNCTILVISGTMIPTQSGRSRAENHCISWQGGDKFEFIGCRQECTRTQSESPTKLAKCYYDPQRKDFMKLYMFKNNTF